MYTYQAQWYQMATLKSAQDHTGLTHLLIFWHSGTLALRTERQCPNVKKLKSG